MSSTDSAMGEDLFESPLAPTPATIAGLCQPAPDALRVNMPTHVLPFHMLLKAAASFAGDGPQTRQLLDHIAVENHLIEVSDRFDRDVSEDGAATSANAASGGTRREQARPVAGAAVLGLTGEI